jgi:RNA polymerase sigma-70 factor, ECF subfamily
MVDIEPAATATEPHDAARLRAAITADDGEALARLFGEHTQHLYRVCLGVLHHREDAEDAVQETIYRALRSADAFRGDANLRTWLTRIAINVCLASRVSVRSATTAIEDEPGPSCTEASVIARVLLGQALLTLTPRQRAILLLKEMSGWSVREIAEANGWSETRVRLNLYRIRRRLRAWARTIDEEDV